MDDIELLFNENDDFDNEFIQETPNFISVETHPNHHLEVEQKIPCDICGKLFKSRGMNIHKAIQKKQ